MEQDNQILDQEKYCILGKEKVLTGSPIAPGPPGNPASPLPPLTPGVPEGKNTSRKD